MTDMSKRQLTPKCLQVLKQLREDQTAKDIARALDLSHVAVNRRIAFMKKKYNCTTSSRLIWLTRDLDLG